MHDAWAISATWDEVGRRGVALGQRDDTVVSLVDGLISEPRCRPSAWGRLLLSVPSKEVWL